VLGRAVREAGGSNSGELHVGVVVVVAGGLASVAGSAVVASVEVARPGRAVDDAATDVVGLLGHALGGGEGESRGSGRAIAVVVAAADAGVLLGEDGAGVPLACCRQRCSASTGRRRHWT
jgi:hypothetical protein